MKLICPNNFAHVGKSCGPKCTCFPTKTKSNKSGDKNEN